MEWKLAYLLTVWLCCVFIPNIKAEEFTTNAITITLSNSLNIELARGREFRFGFAAKVVKSATDKKISGSNLWKVSGWFGSSEDGSGNAIGFVDQLLTSGQSGNPYKKAARLTINGILYTLPPMRARCSDMSYFCVQFGTTDSPQVASGGNLEVFGNPDDSVLTKCVETPQCTENTDICIEDGTIYDVGASWKPHPCRECTCTEGGTSCQVEECQPTCGVDYQIFTTGVCCPACPTSCQVDGTSYDIGASWQVDECTRCTCSESGKSNCIIDQCSPTSCPGGRQPITRSGFCCPSCPLECDDDGSLYLHLEEWKQDACTSCDCFDGSIQCDVETCSPLQCDESAQIQGADDCCAECALECVDRNSFYPHGASWSPDVCTNCTCYNGTSACGIQYCESTLCPAQQVVTRYGECCPACARGCSYEGQEYDHLDRWSSNPCTSCQCNDGMNECDVSTCDTPLCGEYSKVVVLEGECCPSCSEGPPLTVRSTMVKIKFDKNTKLRLGRKRSKLRFSPIVNFENVNKPVTGSNLWDMTVWLSSDEEGNSQLAAVYNIMSDKQSSTDLTPNQRLNFGPTKVNFKIRNPKCKKLRYVCIRFGLSDNVLADGVSLFLDPGSVVQSCTPVPTCKDIKK